MSLKAAAAAFSVSAATAHRWWHRWYPADAAERRSLACLYDRSSRPRRCPRMLPAAEQARICAARRRSGWRPRLIAGETGHAHATVWRTLRRGGLSRRPRSPREQARRYEWPCPGDLLHIDSKRFGRFSRPGHAVTGRRDRSGADKRLRVGWEFVHSIVDDHSRLAYSELHRDERAGTVVGFVERALAFFADHGITTTRLISDNALDLHPQPRARPTAHQPRRPASADPAPPAAGQRQSRALPADPQTRMGTGADLPLQRPPRRRTVTLARALQHAQTAQRPRRTPTDQPRSQPPEAGQLAVGPEQVGSGDRGLVAEG
jgi:transposase